MIGIFFASLCAFGLYRLWRPRRFGHFAYGWAGGGCGRRPGLRHLLNELNATAEQEAAIRQSMEEIAQAFRRKGPWSRLDPLVAALTADTFDRERLSEAMRQSPEDLLAKASVSAIQRLRETLNQEQRQKLAALLNRRFGGR